MFLIYIIKFKMSRLKNNSPNFQKEISEKYKDYKWKKTKLQNDCNSKEFKLHQTQQFLAKYFTPDYLGISPKYQKEMDKMNKIKGKLGQKGMILYHSVGAGKTCAAIAMAANFDAQGYNILWVTRNSLRQVMYQNIFDQICHPKIKKENVPKSDRAKMAYFNKVTNGKWMKPISYRTFSNLNKKKSKLYRDLKRKNGSEDILKNTLIIVDESHNLSTPKPRGLSQLEKPIIKDVKNLIYNSYQKSGEQSCRLLLLTATPGLNGMVGLVNLINYLTPNEENRLPDDPSKFVKKYLKPNLSDFNSTGRKKFKSLTKKYVSFLDRTKDYNMFAKKEFVDEVVQLTEQQVSSFEKCEKSKKKKIDCMKTSTVWSGPTRKTAYRFEHPNFQKDVVKKATKEIASKFKKLLDKLKNNKDDKHVIFVEEPKFVKILTSVMQAHGYNFILQPTQRLRGSSNVNTLAVSENLKNNSKNFTIFTKGTIYNRNVSRKLVSKTNKLFNKRPDNVNGKKIKFVIIDKNYLEGVSFFDVKHLHIITKPHTDNELEQLVGRVVRTCGHKGLPFKKGKGWSVNIYTYKGKKGSKNYDQIIHDAIDKNMSADELKKVKIENIIVKEIQDNAFDKLLTEAIHLKK